MKKAMLSQPVGGKKDEEIVETRERAIKVLEAKGWENARGCKIEHEAAVAYGLDIIYEE